jgi:hypothetical protein
MKNTRRNPMMKAVPPVALAIAMVFAGPVFASLSTERAPSPPRLEAANETVVFKQHGTPAAYLDATPPAASIAI